MLKKKRNELQENEPFNKKNDVADLKKYLNESQGMQKDIVQLALGRAKRSDYIAITTTVLSVICVLTLHQLFPLAKNTPYLVEIDKATGAVSTLSILKPDTISYSDVEDGYWAVQYVSSRERYNFDQIQSYYDKTILLSDDDALKTYKAQYNGPNAFDVRMKDSVDIIPIIKSKRISSYDPNRDQYKTIFVSFVKEIRFKDQQNVKQIPYLATIVYHYVNNVMTESERNTNPLGYKVISYTATPEAVLPDDIAGMIK